MEENKLLGLFLKSHLKTLRFTLNCPPSSSPLPVFSELLGWLFWALVTCTFLQHFVVCKALSGNTFLELCWAPQGAGEAALSDAMTSTANVSEHNGVECHSDAIVGGKGLSEEET